MHRLADASVMKGGSKGQPIITVMGDLRVSHCVPLIRDDQGLLWGSNWLENRGEREISTDLQI